MKDRPTKHPFDGRCTVKGNTLYVEAFSWPADGLRLEGLISKIRSAKILGGATVTVREEAGPDGVKVPVLEQPARLDPIATVVALRLDGPPRVELPKKIVAVAADGSFDLRARDAEIQGGSLRLQGEGDDENLGYWVNAADSPEWTVRLPKSGRYTVEVTSACDDPSAGAEYEIVVGDSRLAGRVSGTGGWNRFRTERLGVLTLASGNQTLAVKARSKPGVGVMNLARVRLTPE